MRITRVTSLRQHQPFADGPYVLSDGRVDEGFDSLVVRLTVEGGTRVVQGWGDMSPLGAMYDPAFADGARAAVRLLTEVPLGISVDPTVFDPPIIDEGEG